MAKQMYSYKNVQVPAEAADRINKIYKQREEAGKKVRKADLWLEAAGKVEK